MEVRPVALESIKLDGNTKARLAPSEQAIADYTVIWKENPDSNPFPPCDLFWDGKLFWCADGAHRVLSAKRAGKTSVMCNIHHGQWTDAFEFACTANDTHGVRFTQNDKRFAVNVFLTNDNWKNKTNREIAKLAGVSHTFVNTIKTQISNPEPPTTPAKPKGSAHPPRNSQSQQDDENPCPVCGSTYWLPLGTSWICDHCEHPWGKPIADEDINPRTIPVMGDIEGEVLSREHEVLIRQMRRAILTLRDGFKKLSFTKDNENLQILNDTLAKIADNLHCDLNH